MAQAKKGGAKASSQQETLMAARMDARVAFFIQPKTIQLAIDRATMASPRGADAESLWLKHLWVRVTANQIEVIGHNHQIGVKGSYPVEASRTGEFLLPPTAFQVFKALDRRVMVQVINEAGIDHVIIESGKFNCKIPTQDVKGYLDHLPNISYSMSLELNEVMVIGMIDRTLFSVANDDSRYGLNGLYIEVGDKDDHGQTRGEFYLRMVSTDGHRLSRVEAKLDRKTSGAFFALVDRGLVTIWKRLWNGATAETSGLVKLELSEKFARLSDASLQVWGKLLEGDFPDYRQVVPKSFSQMVQIPHEPILEMCQRSMIMTSASKQPSIKLSVDSFSRTLELSSSHMDVGEYREELKDIAVDTPNMESFQIGLNPAYFVEALKALSNPEVRLCLTNTIGPCVLNDKDDASIQYVLMPIRLS